MLYINQTRIEIRSHKNVISMYLYIPVREIIKTNSPIFKYVWSFDIETHKNTI